MYQILKISYYLDAERVFKSINWQCNMRFQALILGDGKYNCRSIEFKAIIFDMDIFTRLSKAIDIFDVRPLIMFQKATLLE